MLENHTIFQHITSGTFCSLFVFFPCPRGAQKKKKQNKKKNRNLQNVCAYYIKTIE